MAINWFPHWRSIEAGGGYIKSVTLEDHEQALAEKDRVYRQLLTQAARLAKHCIRMIPYSRVEHEEAQAFLKAHQP